MAYYLVGDIGGTNARFGLVSTKNLEVISVQTFSGRNFATLGEAVNYFLSNAQCGPKPQHACFAVASPIVDDEVKFTNSSWSFSIRALKEALGLEKLVMINDFEAVARSIAQLKPEHKHRIGSALECEAKTKAVLGPGTGLGMAILAPHQGTYLPLPTEGGHAGFSPVTEREFAVKKILQKKFAFVSNETLLCGAGLINLYQSLAELEGKAASSFSAETIAELALAGTDPLALEAFCMFFEILGSVAGDYALQTGAQGGVYVGGGIAPRYIHFIESSLFRSRFESKGRFLPYVKAISTYIITAEYPGLIGAATVLQEDD